MTDAAALPAESPELSRLRASLAAIDAKELQMPILATLHYVLPRLDRAEVKNALLGEYIVYLLQRIERLESEIGKR